MNQHTVSEVDGVRVVTEHVPGVRSASLGVWINVGSANERAGQTGSAHFLEHMLFKGNDRWGAERISGWFDSIGSDANAATTKEYTVVHSRVLDRHVDTAFEVLGEMTLAPACHTRDLDSEREVILEEIAMYEDSPSDVAHELADLLVFDEHPLGKPILGIEQDVAATTAASLTAFHAVHYTPESLVVSAAGNVEHEQIVDAVRTRFLSAPSAAVTPTSDAKNPAVPVSVTQPRATVVAKDAEQVHLCLSGRGVSRQDDRRYALALLDILFGSTSSSRLFLEVRERRGLAYTIYSYTSQYRTTGQIGTYVAVRPDRVEEVLQVLATELDTLCAQPPFDTELTRARDHLEGRLLLSMESTTVRGNRLGAALINDVRVESIETTMERLHAVTPADVHAVAQELYRPDVLSFAAVAQDPEPVISATQSTLGLTNIAVHDGRAAELAAR